MGGVKGVVIIYIILSSTAFQFWHISHILAHVSFLKSDWSIVIPLLTMDLQSTIYYNIYIIII